MISNISTDVSHREMHDYNPVHFFATLKDNLLQRRPKEIEIALPEPGETLDQQKSDEKLYSQSVNFFEAIFYITQGYFFTALIALPYAFMIIGWGAGLILFTVFCLLNTYASVMLIKNIQEIKQKSHSLDIDYAKSMQIAIKMGPRWLHGTANCAKVTVDCLLVLYSISICALYAIIFIQLIGKFLEFYFTNLEFSEYFLCLMLPWSLYISFAWKPKNLLICSTVAGLLLLLGFAGFFKYAIQDLDLKQNRVAFNEASFLDYTVAMGIIAFATQSIDVVLAIEAKMDNPQKLLGINGAFSWSISIAIIVSLMVAFIGYWSYGLATEDNVLLNLPEEKVAVRLFLIIFAMAYFFNFGYKAYMPVMIAFKYIKDTTEMKQILIEGSMRILFVILSVLCGWSLQSVCIAVSTLCLFSMATVLMILPAILDTFYRFKTSYGKFKIYMVLNILLIGCGFWCISICFFVSVNTIIGKFYS